MHRGRQLEHQHKIRRQHPLRPTFLLHLHSLDRTNTIQKHIRSLSGRNHDFECVILTLTNHCLIVITWTICPRFIEMSSDTGTIG